MPILRLLAWESEKATLLQHGWPMTNSVYAVNRDAVKDRDCTIGQVWQSTAQEGNVHQILASTKAQELPY